ncbi:MAG: hypothetical protein ACKOQ6_05150, partial [Bacteroidota bacterium]
PSIACYQTATFNGTTCQWDVTGTQPQQPTIACYQTATFNGTTCQWDVTGTQPQQPTIACYETATFNGTTCQWDVTGTQPQQPSVACYETATFNTTTCQWDVTGTPSPTITTTASACDSYTWAADGLTYTSSGTYNYSANCQDYQLLLTVTASSSNTTTITYCEAYTWNVNGQTYSQSGTYTSVSGCATEILDLTISPMTVTATVTSPIACFEGTGSVTVTATGGQSPYYGTGAQVTAAGTWSFTVTDDNGCSATSGSVTLTEPTKVLGTSTTVSAVCGFNNGSATVTATGGAGNYTYLWFDGQTSATATGLGTGSYSVTITVANGCTGSATAFVGGTGAAPGAAGAISGPGGACRNSTVTYSVAAVSGATSYNWTLPAGATGTSTTNSITLSFSSTYAGGFICVTPSNFCGNGAQSCLNVPVITVKPTQPGTISLSAPACGPAVITCSVAPVPNATSYLWTLSGTLASIVSGQGTSSITVSVPSGFTNAQLSVIASNCLGTSSARYQTLVGLAVIGTGLTGPIYVCANTTQTYSVGAAVGATNYLWSITGNASILSTSGTSCVVKTNTTWTG